MPLYAETFAHIIRGTGSIDMLPQRSRKMEEEMGGKEEDEVVGRKELGGEQEGEGEEVGGCSGGG